MGSGVGGQKGHCPMEPFVTSEGSEKQTLPGSSPHAPKSPSPAVLLAWRSSEPALPASSCLVQQCLQALHRGPGAADVRARPRPRAASQPPSRGGSSSTDGRRHGAPRDDWAWSATGPTAQSCAPLSPHSCLPASSSAIPTQQALPSSSRSRCTRSPLGMRSLLPQQPEPRVTRCPTTDPQGPGSRSPRPHGHRPDADLGRGQPRAPPPMQALRWTWPGWSY